MGLRERSHRSGRKALGLALLFLFGCQRELDMAKDYDDRNAATTIRYVGIREASRQYPDYEGIRGDILKAEGRAP